MDFVNKVLGLYLGNKYEKDIKEISPYVKEILQAYDKLRDISNDQLREYTSGLKKELAEALEADEKEIVSLRH